MVAARNDVQTAEVLLRSRGQQVLSGDMVQCRHASMHTMARASTWDIICIYTVHWNVSFISLSFLEVGFCDIVPFLILKRMAIDSAHLQQLFFIRDSVSQACSIQNRMLTFSSLNMRET